MENLLTAIKIADFIAKYADRSEVIILAIILCIVLYFYLRNHKQINYVD